MNAALPVLYSFRRCPYAMRARLAIAVSGQRCELREVVLKNKPPEMLAASPKGTVPVLVFSAGPPQGKLAPSGGSALHEVKSVGALQLPNGAVIEESLEIMLWALRRNDPEGWLMPQRESLDTMQALIADNDGAFKQSLDRYKYPNRYAQEHAGDARQFALAQQASGAGWLAGLESMLVNGGWLFGSKASLADMAILPFVRQFAHTDPAWFAAQPWPNLLAWLAGWEASALYASVMEKYPPWQTGHAGIGFPA